MAYAKDTPRDLIFSASFVYLLKRTRFTSVIPYEKKTA